MIDECFRRSVSYMPVDLRMRERSFC